MADWFRNQDWNREIEATFEARLRRANSKAQYLVIQAYSLLATHPRIAADLCRRAFALGESSQTAKAGLYLGTALAVEGDVDGAISAWEAAIAAEQQEPAHRTAAHLDQALLIALARRDDLYDLALQRLDRERALPVGDQAPTALIALTLIRSERGEDVIGPAAHALRMIDDTNVGDFALPPCLSLRELKSRLSAAAGL